MTSEGRPLTCLGMLDLERRSWAGRPTAPRTSHRYQVQERRPRYPAAQALSSCHLANGPLRRRFGQRESRGSTGFAPSTAAIAITSSKSAARGCRPDRPGCSTFLGRGGSTEETTAIGQRQKGPGCSCCSCWRWRYAEPTGSDPTRPFHSRHAPTRRRRIPLTAAATDANAHVDTITLWPHGTRRVSPTPTSGLADSGELLPLTRRRRWSSTASTWKWRLRVLLGPPAPDLYDAPGTSAHGLWRQSSADDDGGAQYARNGVRRRPRPRRPGRHVKPAWDEGMRLGGRRLEDRSGRQGLVRRSAQPATVDGRAVDMDSVPLVRKSRRRRA